MKDSWSLKGRDYNGMVYLGKEPESKIVYLRDDIELLRQKLIEDIKETDNIMALLTTGYIIQIINKCFGVEE